MNGKHRPRRRRGLSGSSVRLLENLARQGWRPRQPLRRRPRNAARRLRRFEGGAV